MDTTIIITLITVVGTVIVSAFTFYFTKRHELNVDWQKQKINHYKALMSAISDLAVDRTDKEKANMNLSLAWNTIALVASQDVITEFINFHDNVTNQNRSNDRHDDLLIKLLLAIRRDIGLGKKDNQKTFDFHLIGSAPKK